MSAAREKRMRILPRSALLILAGSCLGACGGLLGDPRFSREEGWRHGIVKETGIGAGFAARLSGRCRALLAKRPSPVAYATVRVLVTHRPYDFTVPLDAGAHWKRTDPVYVNVQDCSMPMAPRPAS